MRVWIENPFDNLPGEGGRALRLRAIPSAISEMTNML